MGSLGWGWGGEPARQMAQMVKLLRLGPLLLVWIVEGGRQVVGNKVRVVLLLLLPLCPRVNQITHHIKLVMIELHES